MPEVRMIVLGMEDMVNETAELAAAMRRLAHANSEDGLVDAERAGLYRMAVVIQSRADSVVAAWHTLDAATSPGGGAR